MNTNELITFERDNQYKNVIVRNYMHHDIGLIFGNQFQPDMTNCQISLEEMRQIVNFMEREKRHIGGSWGDAGTVEGGAA